VNLTVDKKILIEVCCGSLEDAVIAEKAGADRIELNSCLGFGGLTPSSGSIIAAKRKLNIPVIAMIRPRAGGFCYSHSDMDVMEQDVKEAINCGADGIAFGILKEDGSVDIERCKRIIDLAGEKEVVFHRAFDVVPDTFEALDILVGLGVKRILTKGQQNNLVEGVDLINKLVEYAGNRMEILPGGVKRHNIEDTIFKLNVNQIHIASYVTKVDNSVALKPHVFFGAASKGIEDRYDILDFDFVTEIIRKVNKGR
jgi:copper homeostasis protein